MKSSSVLKKILEEAARPVSKLDCCAWANKYLILPSTSAEPGKYRTERTPYVEEILKSFTSNEVRRVIVKSSSQIGKSTILLAITGRYAHLDPCNLMILQPTLEMAQDFSKDRLERMIRDSAILTPLFYDLGKSRTANQTILSKFYRGGRLVLAGANSPAGLASRPIRILLCDEVDRFPASASSEGDPVELAAKRTATYWNAKIGLFSTPTLENYSRIEQEYQSGTREKWCHSCPNCGEYHFITFEQMETDYTEFEDELKRRSVVVKNVKWRCPDCGHSFNEAEIKKTPGRYVAGNPEALKNGVRSFWINGFSSVWVSWATILREYLEAQGNPLLEQVVYNTRFGEVYQRRGAFKDEGEFLKRLENYGGEVPAVANVLTAAVDVQHNRLEYEVCGWDKLKQCYGIVRGTVWGAPTKAAVWAELDKILMREYSQSDGKRLKVARCFIDSGYSTDAVYSYCESRQARGIFPIKGKGGAGLPTLYQFGQAKNANVALVILGVDTLKSEVMARLGLEPGQALSFHFPLNDEHLERGYDQIYFKELLSEQQVTRRSGGQIYMAWEPIKRARNESLDLRGYNIACFESLKVEKSEPKKTGVVASRNFDIWNG